MKILYKFPNHNQMLQQESLHDPNIVLCNCEDEDNMHIHYDYPPYDAEIEFLKSTGSQIIRTGYIPVGTDNDIYITFIPEGYPSGAGNYSSMAFAAYTAEANRTYRMIRNNGNNSSLLLYNGSKAGGGGASRSITLGTKYTVSMTHDFKYTWNNVNGTLNSTSGSENTVQLSLMTSIVKLFSFKWVKNGVTIFDFIPVRVGTTGYLFDKISGKLYGNSGTGAFTLGSDVTTHHSNH